jgi:capsular exopolysaccharide synthesis family protein
MNQTERNPDDLSEDSASNVMEYVYLFWRWAWLIVLAGVLAGGVAYFNSHRTPATFQTSARLFVSMPNTYQSLDSSGLFTSYNMTTTFAQMLTDAPVLQNVIDQLGLNIDPDQLRGAISVSEITNTQLIEITVSGTNPGLIINIANTLGAEFADYVSNMQSARYAASKDALSTQVTEMGAQVDATTAELAQLTDPTQRPALEARLAQYQQLYAGLVSSYEQVRMAEAQNTTNVTVTDPARNAFQTGPNTMRSTLLAMVVAMVLAAGVVFIIEFLDNTIKDPEEIRRKFGLPILGVIARHTQVEGKPITQQQPRSPVSESFRTLRTNVTYAAVDTPLRWIMVTSPTPLDGKTTVCANLGVVFAQGGKKAVIVDGDLRRPMESRRFGLVNASGLSELFLHPLDSLDGSVQATTIPGLNVVTSGALPPNPAELMASRTMLDILERLNADNDLVLVDTPPVLTVTDAAALAPGMDGVILVAKPGVTKLAAFKQTLEQLQGVGAKVLGVVLNEVDPKSHKYGYYYHRYYSKYSYYYTADGTKKRKSHSADSS